MFGLTILGNNSAIPAFDRHPTSQALTYEDQVFLIDCGEGTQMQLAKYKVKVSKINHIFISHLHGDHYFGLIGLITSMGLMNREAPLHIYAPKPLWSIITAQLQAAETQLPFPLEFVPLTQEQLLLDSSKMKVSCFPVKHRVPCFGFLFTEKKLPRKIDIEKAKSLGIPSAYFHQLQLGSDYLHPGGRLIQNATVTMPNLPGRTYAYSADTLFDESHNRFFKGVNLLYHEATYLHEWAERAAARHHATAKQAAQMAKQAGVQQLIIGHFSSKYEKLDAFLNEATEIFPRTALALEGVTYRILQQLTYSD